MKTAKVKVSRVNEKVTEVTGHIFKNEVFFEMFLTDLETSWFKKTFRNN